MKDLYEKLVDTAELVFQSILAQIMARGTENVRNTQAFHILLAERLSTFLTLNVGASESY